jgi:hypothetical protein
MKFALSSIQKCLLLIVTHLLFMQCSVERDSTLLYQSLLTRNWKVECVYINNAAVKTIATGEMKYCFSTTGNYDIVTSISYSNGKWELNPAKAIISLDKDTPGELNYQILHIAEHKLEIETILPATTKDPLRILRLLMTPEES